MVLAVGHTKTRNNTGRPEIVHYNPPSRDYLEMQTYLRCLCWQPCPASLPFHCPRCRDESHRNLAGSYQQYAFGYFLQNIAVSARASA